MLQFVRSLPALWRFYGYRPQPVNIRRLYRWLYQVSSQDRSALADLLPHVLYFTEKQIREMLVRLNSTLLERLQAADIPMRNVIYMQIHEAGSSSGVVLNMLRDAARLQNLGVHLLSSHEGRRLNDLTNRLEKGAVIYIDDFSGSGVQFIDSWNVVSPNIVGTFSEFFLLPCICKEAVDEISARGIECVAGHVHVVAERP